MRENLNSKQYKSASFKGITLIALVVTIIVLLILAGVTIMTLFGDNGLISMAEKAKGETENAQANDITGLGSLSNQMNSVLNGSGIGGGSAGGNEPVPEGVYSIAGVEPAPQDLFYYEPISTTTGELDSTELSGLPEKKARITGMNEKYCNSVDYNFIAGNKYTYTDKDGKSVAVPNTYYGIEYNGTTISDTLVIPYKVKIGDEYYTVTEVNLRVSVHSCVGYNGFPAVKTIIYPNTVETIVANADMEFEPYGYGIKNVILSKNLKQIGEGAIDFIMGCEANVWLSKTVTNIGSQAGWNWSGQDSKGTIKFAGSEEEWHNIGYNGLDEGVKVEYKQSAPTTIPQ